MRDSGLLHALLGVPDQRGLRAYPLSDRVEVLPITSLVERGADLWRRSGQPRG